MTDRDEIQRKLIEKYGAAVISAGLSAALNRGREYRFNHPEPVRSAPPEQPVVHLPADYLRTVTSETSMLASKSESVKIWPVIVLASIRANQGGAARAWFIARNLDLKGTGQGHIQKAALREYLKIAGVDDRQRRRWLSQALELGLLTLSRSGSEYYIVGLAEGAKLLGVQYAGRPAVIAAHRFVDHGWRAYIWAAYLATLNNRPISQETKCNLTGIDPRTQRIYQSKASGSARPNYTQTILPGSHISGMHDNGKPGAFIGRNGKIVVRLPDIRVVPMFVAQSRPRGRSRKVQKQLNSSFSLERAKGNYFRLFHETHQGLEKEQRKLAHADVAMPDAPTEMFELELIGRKSNLWRPVLAGGIFL